VNRKSLGCKTKGTNCVYGNEKRACIGVNAIFSSSVEVSHYGNWVLNLKIHYAHPK
jgi:hypothetical protein